MNIEQFGALFKGLKSAYPNFKTFETKEAFQMWYKLLADIPPEKLEMAIVKHIATSKYPPSIAEIREIASFTPVRDWGEAWGYVIYAIKSFGSYREEDALDCIRNNDELAYKVTKRLGFKEICMSEDLSIERANFRMAYETSMRHEADNNMLPNNMKIAIEQMTKKMNMNYQLEEVEEK